MRAALASSNRHKARELATLLPGWEVEPLDMGGAPAETGQTFRENALIKAHYGRSVADADVWVIGEDSGIEVDALDGAPGIRSARFAGLGATDEENVEALVAALRDVRAGDRGARYVCELVCLAPDGCELGGSGTLEGRVIDERRGDGGFGYDPIFIPVGERRTVAELGETWKAGHSHRSVAARALLAAAEARGERSEAPERPCRCGSLPPMDPVAALADLTEVSGQVESAIMLGQDGAVLACTIDDADRALSLSRLVRDVLAAAQAAPGSGREPLVQLQVALPDGCLFVAQDESRIVSCVTVPFPTPGLVFYDMKNSLRQVAGEAATPSPRPWEGEAQDGPGEANDG